MKSPRVISDPEVLGGTPVFIGTRVPVRIRNRHAAYWIAQEFVHEQHESSRLYRSH